MIMTYFGNYPYNKQSVNNSAPEDIGVYYLGSPNPDGKLGVLYVGRAVGDGVTVRSRLSDHFADGWSDVSHFGYCVCTTVTEAVSFEGSEIKRLQPKYNKIGKSW